MKCKYCQAELEDGAAVCPVCGKEIEPEALEGEAVPMEETPAAEEAPSVEETPAAEEVPAAPAVPEIKEGVKATPGKIALAIVAGVVVLAILVALVISGIDASTPKPLDSTEAPTEPTAAEETVEVTEGTIPPDGNPDDVTCKGTYTVLDEDVIASSAAVVATMDGVELTVGQLQIYYWAEVYNFLNSYGDYAAYFGLDYTQPLDTQTCTLGETPMTWQQFFLSSALDSWRSYQSMDLEGKANGLQRSEEAQSELDSLPQDMENMAVSYGFETADALLQANYGPAVTIADYTRYMEVYYDGYTYFNDVYDKSIPTAEEIEAYFTEHEAEYSESGITRDGGKYYDVRHILVMVEGGTTDEAGSVTYSDEEWEACRAEAQEILDTWLAGDATEESFAALAGEKSEDGGSSSNGGLYEGLTVDTSFVENFKAWYLDESRKPGDYGLVQTEYGYHIMYFSGSTDIWYATAENDLVSEKIADLIPATMEKHPAEIDYSAIKLCLMELA